jgi:hypothetical protein
MCRQASGAVVCLAPGRTAVLIIPATGVLFSQVAYKPQQLWQISNASKKNVGGAGGPSRRSIHALSK